jgi:hypothetical protein
MTCRRPASSLAVLLCILLAAYATAQTGDRHLDTEGQVLDVLFSSDVTPRPYFLKMILRFGDSDTQLAVVVYPDSEKYWIRRYEVTSYKLAGMSREELSQLISKMGQENHDVKAEEIAAKVRVDVTRSPIDKKALDRALEELKGIRISPILNSRVALDECRGYEFWYDIGQESVHYTLVCPFGHDPEDRLVKWMIKFRASLPDSVKPDAASSPSRPE